MIDFLWSFNFLSYTISNAQILTFYDIFPCMSVFFHWLLRRRVLRSSLFWRGFFRGIRVFFFRGHFLNNLLFRMVQRFCYPQALPCTTSWKLWLFLFTFKLIKESSSQVIFGHFLTFLIWFPFWLHDYICIKAKESFSTKEWVSIKELIRMVSICVMTWLKIHHLGDDLSSMSSAIDRISSLQINK